MLGSFFFFMVLPLQVCFQLLTANHTADESWFELDLFSDLFRHYVVILSSRHANFVTKKKNPFLERNKDYRYPICAAK